MVYDAVMHGPMATLFTIKSKSIAKGHNNTNNDMYSNIHSGLF